MIFTEEQIARVCHEANRALQIESGDPEVSAPWDETPDWQRASVVNGIRAARNGASPERLHEAWCLDKQADGWVYGAAKNPAAKTHPCLVAYAELAPEQRTKDALFVAIVAAIDGRQALATGPAPR